MFTVDVKQQYNNNLLSHLLESELRLKYLSSTKLLLRIGPKLKNCRSRSLTCNLKHVSLSIIKPKIFIKFHTNCVELTEILPGLIAQPVGHLTCKAEVLGVIPGLATYFRFSFC